MGLPLNSCYLPELRAIMTSAAERYILGRSVSKQKNIKMLYLLTGLVLFFGIHSLPMFPTFRTSLESRLGEMRFKGIYSLIALAGFALILVGMSRAEFTAVFQPPAWAPGVANFAMPVAFCLLVAAYVPNNFRRVIRHPMLSGVFLWAFVHLLTNGDLASILLFGAFGAYSVIDIISLNRRTPASEIERQPLGMDVLVLAIGFAAFWTVRYFHLQLFGVPA